MSASTVPQPPTATAASLDQQELDAIVRSVAIPPRPSLLADLQRELAADDPDLPRVARIVGLDVAMTATLLRTVNSPFYGLRRRCETVDQAVQMLGLKQVGVLVMGLLMRQSLRGDGPTLTRFWDVSSKRAFAAAQLARALGGVDVDIAQSFGLFCDIGIPLLMQRFADYPQTLKVANGEAKLAFTVVEQAVHHTDHAMVGALMARTWGVSQAVVLAIRLHHDYTLFTDPDVPATSARLVAMGLVAELAIQRFAGMNHSHEWIKGGEAALGALMLDASSLEDHVETLVQAYASGVT